MHMSCRKKGLNYCADYIQYMFVSTKERVTVCSYVYFLGPGIILWWKHADRFGDIENVT